MKKHIIMLIGVTMLLMVIGCSDEPMKPESNDADLNLKAITGISVSEFEAMASKKQAGQMLKSTTSGTIDFEDLEGGQHQMFYHNPYHGMTFSWPIFHSDNVGYGNPVSGTNFLFNGWGYDKEYVTLDSPDELEDIWVGTPHEGTKTFWMEGYLGGSLVGQSPVITLSRTMQWLAANFGGQIDSIVFRINEPGAWRPGSWWVLDDMTFLGAAGGAGGAPPTSDAGEDQTVECTGSSSANVTLDGSGSSDPDGDALTYEWSEGGSSIATGESPTLSLSLGTHTITLTVDDGSGETETDEVIITVEDTEAPTVDMTVGPTMLWPPNHTMHLVASGISASDVCCDGVTLVVEVTSNEPVNAKGDGDTDSDWDVVDNGDGTFDVWVRAERAGKGSGRVYTITATATDCEDNETVSVRTVDVSKSKGKIR